MGFSTEQAASLFYIATIEASHSHLVFHFRVTKTEHQYSTSSVFCNQLSLARRASSRLHDLENQNGGRSESLTVTPSTALPIFQGFASRYHAINTSRVPMHFAAAST